MPLSLSPALAAFVVITVDPVATLHALNDPIATAAAREMTPQKYVGYVSKAIDVFDGKAQYHTYAIQFTSPTIPAACESDGISADMCTPVFPATEHLHGRAPLHPRRALPWSGCQQPSFMRSIVRVPVKLEDDSVAILLQPDDAIRHRRILAEEDERRRLSLHASQSSFAEKPGARGSYVEFSDLDAYLGDFPCPIDLVDGSYEDEERYYAELVQANRPPDTSVVVNVSYDLSQVTELLDPLHFFEEKRQLKALIAESRACSSSIIKCPISESQLEVDIIAEHPATNGIETGNEIKTPVYPGTLSSLLKYRQLPELLSTIRIPSSLIREVATTSQRLGCRLAQINSLAQSWMASSWVI
ncbi:hypothetical protein DFH08DRAFT_856100 [Mycena albidolilacea]|uniref:Uncharacterized protein n=1 Tax=Mycena albidolilacea TaxID=1033008 RepID=A0AAD7EWJ9_9AGAR|nr:hypothetical protein DFH08DRAFT_856100 [Mycena albidolilacea]